MDKRNKIRLKGFTITEVITTLVILGIVLAIAIPGVGKLQAKFKLDYYQQLDGSVVAAAKTYFKDNAESKPKGDLAIQKLAYTSLTSAKYIDSIKQYKSETSCTGYVAVLKVKDQYTYTNCMKCGTEEYKTYYSDDVVDITGYTGEEREKKALSNICALAGKDSSDIETEYNTQSLEPLYLYVGSYKGQDLKEVLAIEEEVKLIVDGDVAYSVSTGNEIYPKNITGIDLTKETIVSDVNTGINVVYQNGQPRQVHVYAYNAPIISNSNGKNINTEGIIRSNLNYVTLNLSSIFFNNKDSENQYPKAPNIGENYPSKLTPLYDNGKVDVMNDYFYSIDGESWIGLECDKKHECSILSTKLSKSNKIKFKMRLTTPKGSFDGKETDWYDLKNLVVVSFDANGGNIDSGQTSKEVEMNKKYGSLPVASKIGHSFEGWQTETNGGSIVTENTVVTNENDHTLYAKWDPITYILTFNANGGSVSETSKLVKYDKKYDTLPIPTRTGYTFNGWFTSLSGGVQVTSDTKMGAANTTIYARWTPISLTVTLNANGGSVSPNNMTVQYDSTYGTLPSPTKSGYTFVGWYTELTNGTPILNSTKITKTINHTLYAIWEANSYMVTLHARGGTVSPAGIKVTYGSQYGTLPEPILSGFVFNGWYTSEIGGSQITSTTTMNTASNHTLYAQWTEIITESITASGCNKKNIPAGVYYVEIIGGGAGGAGRCRILPKPKSAAPFYGGNAAKWAGYVYLPAMTDASVCVGQGSSGSKFGDPSNGGSSYIANSSGTKLIEVMGGKSYVNTPYSSSITNFNNGAVQILACKNIIGAVTTRKDYKGDGGYKSSCATTYSNASSGKNGIINYQYVKSLEAWNASPEICPTTMMCSSTTCGW